MAKAKPKNTESKVAINRDGYEAARAASGAKSLSNGDEVAKGMAGLTVDEAIELTVSFVPGEDWGQKYGHLNDGMIRMNCGNRIRGQITKLDKAADKAEADGKKRPADGATQFAKVVAPFRKNADKRVADEAKAKADAKKEKADAKKENKAA